jgi:hypothetical protein
MFKCHYQKWRLDWTFSGRGWRIPRNILVVPHGARPDRHWGPDEIPGLRHELGLDRVPHLGAHLVGLIGWIQSNKRWDILTSMWEDIATELRERTGEDWDLLAAGTMRDPAHREHYERWKSEVQILEQKGLAHYYEFVPRGEIYYKTIALNKPFLTTAPMEGLTAQTLESEGGFLFTTKAMLRQKLIRLACDEGLRHELGDNLRRYLDTVVSWDVVTGQYDEAYALARDEVQSGRPVALPAEF